MQVHAIYEIGQGVADLIIIVQSDAIAFLKIVHYFAVIFIYVADFDGRQIRRPKILNTLTT